MSLSLSLSLFLSLVPEYDRYLRFLPVRLRETGENAPERDVLVAAGAKNKDILKVGDRSISLGTLPDPNSSHSILSSREPRGLFVSSAHRSTTATTTTTTATTTRCRGIVCASRSLTIVNK